jgi:hypothetical protein
VASYKKDDLGQGRTAKTCAKPPGAGVRNTQMWKMATGSIGGEWHVWTGYNPGVPERRDDLSDDQKEKHFFGKDELVRITLFIERMS